MRRLESRMTYLSQMLTESTTFRIRIVNWATIQITMVQGERLEKYQRKKVKCWQNWREQRLITNEIVHIFARFGSKENVVVVRNVPTGTNVHLILTILLMTKTFAIV